MSNIFIPEGQHDTIVIFAPGPSLTKEQVGYVMSKGVFTIAIGDAYLLNPFADLLYHCDARWWNYYKGVDEFYGCQRVSLEETPDYPLIKQLVQSRSKVGLDLEKPKIVTGGNSGYQAINLAIHYKPKKLLLLGYDLKHSATGQYNVRGDHPPEIKGKAKTFKSFIRRISTLKEPLDSLGVMVYNCSIDTDLECFHREDIRNVL